MKRYIALLRGINISGKNKISMSELKKGFAELGFVEILTYLNSGNIVFSSEIEEEMILSNKIASLIKDKFNLDISVFIILQEALKERLEHAPAWWGDDHKEIYDNLIFMMPPLSYEKVYDEMGDPNVEYEKASNYKEVIFWSFSRKDYQKTNWYAKTASSLIAHKITIRTANTIRKIVNM